MHSDILEVDPGNVPHPHPLPDDPCYSCAARAAGRKATSAFIIASNYETDEELWDRHVTFLDRRDERRGGRQYLLAFKNEGEARWWSQKDVEDWKMESIAVVFDNAIDNYETRAAAGGGDTCTAAAAGKSGGDNDSSAAAGGNMSHQRGSSRKRRKTAATQP